MVLIFARPRAVPQRVRIGQVGGIGAIKLLNLEVPMKTLILTATLIAATLSTVAPVSAMTLKAGLHDIGMMQDFDRKGRRPRTPGGSGCDGAGDVGKPGC